MIKKISLSVLVLLFFNKAESQDSALAIGDSLYQLGNYAAAINSYAKAPSAYSKHQIARAYNTIGNYEKAVLQYETLLKEYDNLFLASFELGKLYYKIKSFDKAYDLFSSLLQKGAQNPQYHYYLGLILREQSKSAASLSAFREAIDIDSTHLKSIHEIGKYYLVNREKDSVVKYVDKGLLFYPNSVELINIKALSLFNNGDLDLALPLFEKLIELKQQKEYIYDRLGQCYVNEKNYEKAVEAYENALKFDDENPKTLSALGHIHWKIEEYEKAISFFEKVIDVQKVTFEKEYIAMARVSLDQKNMQKAINYYELAYKEAPSFFIYYQICFLADNYYKDPKVRLGYYENYIKRYGKHQIPLKEYVEKRISELNTEIHLSQE